MPQLLIGFVLALVVSPPTPQPELKTIVTVHSSQFCTALILAVRPALVGMMRNDQLISLGRSALSAGDRDAKFGGQVESSFNQRGAATWTPNSGVAVMLDNRQRQLAAAMAQNIETAQTLLANPNAPTPGGEDQAKLAAIKAQLTSILNQQRSAMNVIAGNADTSELAGMYNAPSTTGVETDNLSSPTSPADLNGISALNARLTSQNNVVAGPGAVHGAGSAVETTEPFDQSQASIAKSTSAMPFYSPYAKLVLALGSDQQSIERSEESAAKTIVDAVQGCL